jgi:hypothetical protein
VAQLFAEVVISVLFRPGNILCLLCLTLLFFHSVIRIMLLLPS